MFPYPWKPSPHCKNKYKGKSELEHLLVVHYQKPSFYNHNLINRQCCRAYYLIPPNLPFCRELGLSDKPHVNSLHGTLEGCPLKTCDIVGTRNWVRPPHHLLQPYFKKIYTSKTFGQVPLYTMLFLCAFLKAPWMVFKMASASKSQTSCVEKKSRLKLNTQKNQKKKENEKS